MFSESTEFSFKAQDCIAQEIDLLKGSFTHLHPLDVVVHDLGMERSCVSTDQLNFPVFNDVIPLAQFCFLLWDTYKSKYCSEVSYATRNFPQNSILPFNTFLKKFFLPDSPPNAIYNK